jgi:hypothetical protein
VSEPLATYEAIDLSAVCDVPWVKFHAAARNARRSHELPDPPEDRGDPTGARIYRGIPFLVGAQDGSGRILARGGAWGVDTVSIAIGRRASRVVFAHCLVTFDDDADPGGLCSTYEFVLAGGEKIAVPIHSGLEIGAADDPWFLEALLAWPDQGDSIYAGDAAEWEGFSTGGRPAEVQAGRPQHFYLWAWSNPDPAREIEAVVVRPAGPAFAIAGVTVSHADESPFPRAGRRSVVLEILDEAEAAKEFAIAVDVDRGTVTMPHPLPAGGVSAFLDASLGGFGQAHNGSGNPAYAEIAATPSASVTVRRGEAELGSFRFGELEERGELDASPSLRVRLAFERPPATRGDRVPA